MVRRTDVATSSKVRPAGTPSHLRRQVSVQSFNGSLECLGTPFERSTKKKITGPNRDWAGKIRSSSSQHRRDWLRLLNRSSADSDPSHYRVSIRRSCSKRHIPLV